MNKMALYGIYGTDGVLYYTYVINFIDYPNKELQWTL